MKNNNKVIISIEFENVDHSNYFLNYLKRIKEVYSSGDLELSVRQDNGMLCTHVVGYDVKIKKIRQYIFDKETDNIIKKQC